MTLGTSVDLYRKALANAAPAIDFRTGIISDIQEKRIAVDDPELSVFASVLADAGQFSFQTSSRFNAGAGMSTVEAQVKAIGEAFERYCAGFYDKSRLTLASYRELGPELAVDPEHFALFSDRQYETPSFPYPRPNDRTRLAWIEGYSLTRDKPLLVPACLVFVPYDPIQHGAEAVLAPAVSSGLACGTSLEGATLSGIYEVIERDAFCITWFRSLELPRVDISVSSALREVYEQKFAACGARYSFTEMTLDVPIPSFLCVCESDSPYGVLATVGASCHLDPELGLLKAMVESAHAKLWLKQLIRTRGEWRPAEDFSNVRNFEDHVLTYRFPEHQSHLSFLKDPGRPTRESVAIDNRSTGVTEQDLAYCRRVLADRGLEVVRVDITSEDVADLGFRVVRILIPGMQEINGRYDRRILGGRRLYDVPMRLGLTDHEVTETDLNPIAHPFP